MHTIMVIDELDGRYLMEVYGRTLVNQTASVFINTVAYRDRK